jgi:EpsI family protein
MNNTTLRLWIVVALVAAAYGVSFLVKAGAAPPEVQLPDWTFSELPTSLPPPEVSSPQGTTWRGEDTEMDPKLTAAIGADSVVDRVYRDEKGNAISMHTAIFANPAEGALHSPINCYRGAGWEKVAETSEEEIPVDDERNVPVNITTWERTTLERGRGRERVVVLYWYQIGEHVLFGRWDLGKVRWAMRGQPVWPATVKVLLQTSAEGDLYDAKTRILDLAEQIGRWIDKRSHQMSVGEKPET